MRLHPRTERQLPARVIALFLDVGWFASWPLEWTREGKYQARRINNWWAMEAAAKAELLASKGNTELYHIDGRPSRSD